MKNRFIRNAHPIVKLNWSPRTFGSLFTVIIILSIFHNRPDSFIWAFMIFQCLIWPQCAYLHGCISSDSKLAEYRNLLFDCILFGAWLPVLSFRLWPVSCLVLAAFLNTTATGGIRFLAKGLICFVLGIIFMMLFKGFKFIPDASLLTAILSIIFIALYSFAVGLMAFRQNKLLIKARKEIKRQRDILDNISKIDGLTGIPNRRRFDEYIDLQWQNSQRSGSSLSVIMIDVDHFKAYNDFYGHGGGDKCLKKIAKTLFETIKRPNDLIARYGGEEFVCLLPATELEGAISIAETMRKNIISQSIPHEKSPVADYVTISLGVSSINPIKESTPSILLETADKALYEAKNNNRNCVRSLSIAK